MFLFALRPFAAGTEPEILLSSDSANFKWKFSSNFSFIKLPSITINQYTVESPVYAFVMQQVYFLVIRNICNVTTGVAFAWPNEKQVW